MIDVQNQSDERGIKIQRAGISEFYLPLSIVDGEKIQRIVAKIRFTVALSKNLRGTHMSRLTEILTEWSERELKIADVKIILLEALEKLSTDFAEISIAFKFFVQKKSPISKKFSFLPIDCEFYGELYRDGKNKINLGLGVPFTSLCPCSKEISDFGAHNQRSICRVKLFFADTNQLNDIRIDKIVRLIERQGSAEIFPLLKREDEKFVTETAYKNPKFAEDILRDVVLVLRGIENLAEFSVECENFESIHAHNAFVAHEEINEK